MNRDSTNTAVVLGFVGPVGDHNESPLEAVPLLAEATAVATSRRAQVFGESFKTIEQSSGDHLEGARPLLEEYADAVREQLQSGLPLVCVNGRCAASLATVPQVMKADPDTVVVWLDAHADLNVPGGSPTDYLGGMAVSGPLGWWDTGFGSGLIPGQLVLVGTRAIDDSEADLIDRYAIAVIAPGQATAAAVVELVAGRPVYFHLDCDVLEPGLFRTDYCEPGGLTLAQLAELATGLAASGSPIVGVEIAEWEGSGSEPLEALLAALEPLLPRSESAII